MHLRCTDNAAVGTSPLRVTRGIKGKAAAGAEWVVEGIAGRAAAVEVG